MLQSQGPVTIIPVLIERQYKSGAWHTVYQGDLEYREDMETYQFVPFGPLFDIKNGVVWTEQKTRIIGKCRLVMQA